MDEEFDCCAFIDKIDKDPAQQVKGLRVRDYLMIRSHIVTCKTCSDKVNSVLERAPKNKEKHSTDFSEN